jgi:hypothetical protein
MLIRHDHEVPAGVGIEIEDHKSQSTSMDHKAVFAIDIQQGMTKNTTLWFVTALHELHSPG